MNISKRLIKINDKAKKKRIKKLIKEITGQISSPLMPKIYYETPPKPSEGQLWVIDKLSYNGQLGVIHKPISVLLDTEITGSSVVEDSVLWTGWLVSDDVLFKTPHDIILESSGLGMDIVHVSIPLIINIEYARPMNGFARYHCYDKIIEMDHSVFKKVREKSYIYNINTITDRIDDLYGQYKQLITKYCNLLAFS